MATLELYLIRHGVAAERGEEYPDDSKRPLTSEGIARLRKEAKALEGLGVGFDQILSSPLVHALQTSEVIAAELGIVQVETTRDLAPGGDAVALLRSLIAQKRKRAMVVGHQPDLTILVESVTGDRFPYDMTKSMVVGLRADEGATKLRFVLDPKTLEFHRHE